MEKLKQCEPSANQDQELNARQRLQLHAGWLDAMKGVPFTQSNGPFWAEGWINHHWLKGGQNRSWLRH